MAESQNHSPGMTAGWRGMYRLGAAALLLTLALYVSEFALIRWDQFPASTEAWFGLFQRSKLLGLFYLNALDILSITLLGLLFLALYLELRETDQVHALAAAFFSLLGVVVFVVPRVAMLSLLTLSDRYAAAVDPAEQARLLAAGETLGSLGTPTPQTAGFFFMAIGVLIFSLLMLRSAQFGRLTAWFGILASVVTFAGDISLVLAPALSTPLMILSGLFWIPWWLLISRELFRFSGKADYFMDAGPAGRGRLFPGHRFRFCEGQGCLPEQMYGFSLAELQQNIFHSRRMSGVEPQAERCADRPMMFITGGHRSGILLDMKP